MTAPTKLLLLAALLAPRVLLADEPHAEARVRYAPKTLIEFSLLQIQGELATPGIEHVEARRAARFRVLVRPRDDFYAELVRSIDTL
jgi:hypothetical protein